MTGRRQVLDVLTECVQEPLEVEIEPITDADLEEAVDASIALMCAVLPDELEPALRKHFPTDAELEPFVAGVSAGVHHRPRFRRRCPAY